jgi:hypothetical protein
MLKKENLIEMLMYSYIMASLCLFILYIIHAFAIKQDEYKMIDEQVWQWRKISVIAADFNAYPSYLISELNKSLRNDVVSNETSPNIRT